MRLSSLAGLPVVREGRLRGRVEQAVLCPDGRTVRGLTMRHGLGGARWVDAADIAVLGDVSVIVKRKPGRLPENASYALRTVKDTAGLCLGRVTDAWIDPDTLRVEALEITLGLVEALTCGPLTLRDFRACPISPEEGQVMVPSGAALTRPNSKKEVKGYG